MIFCKEHGSPRLRDGGGNANKNNASSAILLQLASPFTLGNTNLTWRNFEGSMGLYRLS
jgi:hypothetical protein